MVNIPMIFALFMRQIGPRGIRKTPLCSGIVHEICCIYKVFFKMVYEFFIYHTNGTEELGILCVNSIWGEIDKEVGRNR